MAEKSSSVKVKAPSQGLFLLGLGYVDPCACWDIDDPHDAQAEKSKRPIDAAHYSGVTVIVAPVGISMLTVVGVGAVKGCV